MHISSSGLQIMSAPIKTAFGAPLEMISFGAVPLVGHALDVHRPM